MSRNVISISKWLGDIGETIPVSTEACNILENPVQTLKKIKQPKDSKKAPPPTSTRELAKNARSLSELKEMLEKFKGCALKELAKNTVFGDGNPQAKIMLVGEAPGAEEDLQGLPFVGASGKLLDQMLSYIGLDRTKYYITNIVPRRTPGNRNPTTEEISMCLPFIERKIELIQPKILVMVGGVSAKSLLNTSEGIMRLRGSWLKYQ